VRTASIVRVTDVSEVRTASIIRVLITLMMERPSTPTRLHGAMSKEAFSS
jgi:hypothetical protein